MEVHSNSVHINDNKVQEKKEKEAELLLKEYLLEKIAEEAKLTENELSIEEKEHMESHHADSVWIPQKPETEEEKPDISKLKGKDLINHLIENPQLFFMRFLMGGGFDPGNIFTALEEITGEKVTSQRISEVSRFFSTLIQKQKSADANDDGKVDIKDLIKIWKGAKKPTTPDPRITNDHAMEAGKPVIMIDPAMDPEEPVALVDPAMDPEEPIIMIDPAMEDIDPNKEK